VSRKGALEGKGAQGNGLARIRRGQGTAEHESRKTRSRRTGVAWILIIRLALDCFQHPFCSCDHIGYTYIHLSYFQHLFGPTHAPFNAPFGLHGQADTDHLRPALALSTIVDPQNSDRREEDQHRCGLAQQFFVVKPQPCASVELSWTRSSVLSYVFIKTIIRQAFS